MPALTLSAPAMTRRLRAARLGVIRSYALSNGSALRVFAYGADEARQIAAHLIGLGYDAVASADRVTVALPEPVEQTADEIAAEVRSAEWNVAHLDRQIAGETHARRLASLRRQRDEEQARLARLVTDLGSARQAEVAEPAEETLDELIARVEAQPAVARRLAREDARQQHEDAARARITTREELIARQIAGGATPERAAMVADARDRLQRELTAAAPAIGALLDAPENDGLAHLMSDALLDACGTAGPGGLVLMPSTRIDDVTCPRCLLLAVEEEVRRLGYRNAAHYLSGRPALRARVEVAAGRPDSTEPVPADADEADVPPTDEERVTVRIKARELRPGDEVVDHLGQRQYAAFDVLLDTAPRPATVRVWTAIADQERGLPPVLREACDRELLVLRPVSDEGRELLAAQEAHADGLAASYRRTREPEFGSPAWALSLLPENRRG